MKESLKGKNCGRLGTLGSISEVVRRLGKKVNGRGFGGFGGLMLSNLRERRRIACWWDEG